MGLRRIVEVLEFNGNSLTAQMHFFTLHELKKMHALNMLRLKSIEAEKDVILEKKGLRKGSFDFLVEAKNGKTIGFEVLTRPSKGKMKQKLAYAKNVDEFVFVIPEHFLEAYKKHAKNGHRFSTRPKFLPKEFAGEKLLVWIFDVESLKFTQKATFQQLFNVLR